MRRFLLAFAFIVTVSVAASAQCSRILGYANNGGQRAVVSGISSSNRVQQSYPSATVTIFLTGTSNLATLYTNSSCSVSQANPLTASATDASFGFYVAVGSVVDIRFSGTASPTFTWSAVTAPGNSGISLLRCAGTNDTTLLSAANSLGGTIEIPKGITCASNSQTLSAALQVDKGGLLKPLTGQTVTLSGPQIGGIWQRFTNATSGLGTIVLQNDVYPDWWVVNTTPGTTDMAAAINAADASVCSGAINPLDGVTVAAQGRVRFGTAIYRVNSGLTYRGAPWLGEGPNNTVLKYYGSGAMVDAEGTTSARRQLNIQGVYFYGFNASAGTSYAFRLGWNMRSYGAMRQVRVSHFPSYAMLTVQDQYDLSFYDLELIANGQNVASPGTAIGFTSGCLAWNHIDFFNLVLENNGYAGSGLGGGLDTTNISPGGVHQIAMFGGMFQSNRGLAEIVFNTGSNVNIYSVYIESEGTANLLNGLLFDGVGAVGVHDLFITAAAANTGDAVEFAGITTGVVDNLRSFTNWTTFLRASGSAVMQITSAGSVIFGTSPVVMTGTAQIQWPARNQGGVFFRTQSNPCTPTIAATLTSACLFGGLLTATPNATGATHAYTLPTGTNMETVAQFLNNDSFDWSITNLAAAAADTITITANTDHTIVGNPLVLSSHATTIANASAMFRSRRTAGSTWVTYRIN